MIAGKAIPADGQANCFGFVQTYDTKPKRRLFEVLKAQGMQANQQVTFLTDGGEDVRDLPLYLNAQAEHLLDWFHITMRLTVMANMAKGLRRRRRTRSPRTSRRRPRQRDRHAAGAAEVVLLARQRLPRPADRRGPELRPRRRRALPRAGASCSRRSREFGSYIGANAGRIPNYGERYRAGEAISTSFAESTVNQVISKRMVKKQQMRWTPRGAHLLLQVRTRVLNDDLAGDFHRWYPGLSQTLDPVAPAA